LINWDCDKKMLAMVNSAKYLCAIAATLLLVALAACTPPQQPPPETPATAENITDNQTGIQEARPIPEDSMPRISIEDLKQKMDSGANILIVDTRHREEYDFDHIKGAVSAPLDDIVAGKWQPPADRELILYCG
jgi:hypothetical protein